MTILPTFIVINNGLLIIDLRAGEKKDQFKNAILRALSSTSSQPQHTLSQSPDSHISTAAQDTLDQTLPQASTLATSSYSTHPSLSQPGTTDPGVHRSSATSPSPSIQSNSSNTNPDARSFAARSTIDRANMAPSDSPNVHPAAAAPSNAVWPTVATSTARGPQPSQDVQNLLADRRRRLEKEKREKEAAESAERKAKAEARKGATDSAPNSAKAKQATYAAQQRKQHQEAKLERERILRQIEHDKAERREKEERRKAMAKAEAEGNDGAGGLVDQQLASEVNSPKATRTRDCALQVRLFDGSTIRCRFPSDQTLRGHVRPWVDEKRSDDVPYTFKQVLTPMPNRTLSISEEEETLQSLGLSPSATLVITPVQGYTTAYRSRQGIVSKGASAGYSVISTGAGLVTGTLGSFLGLGRATASGGVSDDHDDTIQSNAEADTIESGSGIKIRTLQDQRDGQEDQQLYNGNQVRAFFRLAVQSINSDCRS